MRYRVRALGSGGELAVLSLEAHTEASAGRQAAGQGLRVLSIRRERAAMAWPVRRRATFALPIFTQQLVSLLDAGLGAAEAIEALASKERGPEGELLRVVLQHVSTGRSLSSAFEQAGADFPPLFVATVRAAEKTGDLKEALSRYADYEQRIAALRAKVVSALVYPAMLAVAGALVTAFLLLYVVPRFSAIYEDMGANLPLGSRLLMHWGRLLAEHAGAIALAGGALVAVGLRLAAHAGLRARLARLAWRAPRVGEALRLYHLARFYRTLGMLLRSGLPLLAALGMARGLLAEAMRPSLDEASRRVGEGVAASVALVQAELATPVALSLLRVAERTGEMGAMMERIAGFHDDELARDIDLATRLFEPLLMAAIGIVIGVLVILLYMPVFELANSLQ